MNFLSSANLAKKLSVAFTFIVSFVAMMGLISIVLSVSTGATGLLNPFFLTIITLIIVSVSIYLATAAVRSVKAALEPINDKIYWYESILDAIPFPISVTDMNMKWTFINRPVEQMLKIKRSQVLGKHCSSWGAAICNTSNCGITCLRNNKTVTFFEQMGMDFQVDINYLLDQNNKRVGHIEVVQDISKMAKTQKAQAELIENVHEVSGAFASASKNIAEAAQSLAAGSTEQASAVEQLSASVTNVAVKTKENAAMADKASSLAEAIKANAEKGSVQMSRMTQAVKDINDASQSINQVIKAIDEIASQTNLLALNAAIEAARAGQHGRGFAVVAEEVRNLAVKSAEAAKDTSSLIVNSMEKAEMGMSIANETTAAFDEIVSSIGQSSELVNEIDKSLEGQTAAIHEINQRIGQVAQVVQQNNAIAEESAAVSEEMSSRADTLEHLLVEFKARAE